MAKCDACRGSGQIDIGSPGGPTSIYCRVCGGNGISPFEVYTFDAPAHWASALINGDNTSFDEADEAEFNAWLAAHPDEAREVVSCDNDEPHFRRFNGLQTEMLTYQALRRLEGDET